MATQHLTARALGLYTLLPSLLVPGEPAVEWGIVEHRLHLQHPDLYRLLYEAYGHATQGPRRYSVSAYLARRMGFLAGKGVVLYADGEATGRWDYNGRVSYWALPSGDVHARYTWAQYAADNQLHGHWWQIIGRSAA